jgi:ABC-type branched-subunit amino acid transport system substrate-binding protein/outer membrane murein-binding lipoprotein Lpp
MKQAKLLAGALIIALAALYIAGCAPRATVRDAGSAVSNKAIEISEDEFKEWQKAASGGTSTEERARGTFWMGRYYLNHNDQANAVKYFEYNEKYYGDTVWGYLSVLRLSEYYTLLKQTDRIMEKLKILTEKKGQYPEFGNTALDRLKDTLAPVTKDELKKIYASHYNDIIDEYSLYYICRAEIKESDMQDFYNHAKAFLMSYQNSVFVPEISAEFKKQVKYKPVAQRKLGVILPLTGKAMEVGASIKNSIELALDEYNSTAQTDVEKISLVYVDESLEGDALNKEISRVVEQENVVAFLGPIFSKTVKKVMPLMSSYNIAVFSPTAARPDLSGISDFFFRNCGTVKGHSYAMAKYITTMTPYKKLGTIYPDDEMGRSMDGYFVEKVKLNGGQIVDEVPFASDKSDFINQLVPLGGINTMLLKDKRAGEVRDISDKMDDAGKKIQDKIFGYMKTYRNVDYPNADPAKGELPKINVTLLKFASHGDETTKYNLDQEMTKELSYAVARDKNIQVVKQAATDTAMQEIGVGPEDVDREIALNIAHQMKSDVLIWGSVTEEKTNTIYASFIPTKQEIDNQGNTKYAYKFGDDDYIYYKVNIKVQSVSDEAVIDELNVTYKKLKEPKLNPLGLDALFVPADERKITLIKDQLKFYDLDIPVFSGMFENPSYLLGFMESSQGISYTSEFFPDDPSPVVKDFVGKYREKYAGSPGVIEANTYDMMKITLSILAQGIDSRQSFKDMLKAVKKYKGVTGEFSFDAANDSLKQYYIMKIDGGEKILSRVTGD